MGDDAPTADRPPRKRSSWSLRAIVEDVSGRPIDDFQDPARPTHPYLKVHEAAGSGSPTRSTAPATVAGPASRAPPTSPPADAYDPVGRLYPPLVGAPGREFHGPEHEHHSETLQRHPTATPGIGEKPRSAGPLHRPERLYLHYLLLHLDHLSDAALAYLRSAVEEEVAHRTRVIAAPPAPAPPSPTPAPRAPIAAVVEAAAPPPLPPPALPAT